MHHHLQTPLRSSANHSDWVCTALVLQRRARDLFNAKGVEYKEVDGADQTNLDERNALFGISKQRGKYPQVFIEKEDGTVTFVGLWEKLEVRTDMELLGYIFCQERLAAFPDQPLRSPSFHDCSTFASPTSCRMARA
jgi:glutaredoxin